MGRGNWDHSAILTQLYQRTFFTQYLKLQKSGVAELITHLIFISLHIYNRVLLRCLLASYSMSIY